ncbi:GDP-4-dehydro-6-deoxy-D-mannose reductase [Paenibacillaceae bacterium GAS479]|nr:GDP-4-dehydro-6-deoxy-D-mannose reductase [Paenibacillaceae bacterium GAS479]
MSWSGESEASEDGTKYNNSTRSEERMELGGKMQLGEAAETGGATSSSEPMESRGAKQSGEEMATKGAQRSNESSKAVAAELSSESIEVDGAEFHAITIPKAVGRLFITGANGFCGSHAVSHFAAAGWEVVAGVRPGSQPFWAESGSVPTWFSKTAESGVKSDAASERFSGGAAPGAESDPALERFSGAVAAGHVSIEPCDLSSSGGDSLRQLIDDIRPDAILHLAGLNAAAPSWTDPTGYIEVNVMGTLRLLEAVRTAGHPCRIIVAGSMLGSALREGEELNPPHPYSLSKSLQAAAALSWHAMYGMDVIVAVPSNLVGPGPSAGLNRLLARYAASCEEAAISGSQSPPVFRLSSATEQRDFLDVRDAVRGYETLLERGIPGRSYAMASGRMTPLGELAELYIELSKAPLMLEIGNSHAVSPLPTDSSALRELGWQPLFTLRQSVEDTLADSRNGSHSTTRNG